MGDTDGVTKGADIGLLVGAPLSIDVGVNDGADDGLQLGTPLGIDVGVSEGADDGLQLIPPLDIRDLFDLLRVSPFFIFGIVVCIAATEASDCELLRCIIV